MKAHVARLLTIYIRYIHMLALLIGVRSLLKTPYQTVYLCPIRIRLLTQGVVNVAEVAKRSGVERVVLVSSMLVTPKNK